MLPVTAASSTRDSAPPWNKAAMIGPAATASASVAGRVSSIDEVEGARLDVGRRGFVAAARSRG